MLVEPVGQIKIAFSELIISRHLNVLKAN